MDIKKISVIGLGKLGAPLAACLAHKGYEVTGVDANEKAVEAINAGMAPVYEPGLEELIKACGNRLSAALDIGDAVRKTDATFIVVATPSDETGGFSLRYVLPVCEKIAEALKDKDSKHLVVLTSTVMPGSTAGKVVPLMERVSGKKCGTGFGLCYSPEFIALGSVIRDYFNPDFVLIGESDSDSGENLNSIYRATCDNSPPAARMNFINAELTKLSVNTFITTKITFSNTLARLCEKLPGADVDAVSSALGLDSRIGGKYLKGAVGYGGPCFPRDTLAFSALAKSVGVSSYLSDATDRTNRAQVLIFADLVKRRAKGNKWTVGILGLSYKPDTNVVEQSQGLLLAAHLAAEGHPVTVYDPRALAAAREVLKDSVAYADTVNDCLKASDIILIMTPWNEFKKIQPEAVSRAGRPRTLVDCWRILPVEAFRAVCDYVALGHTIHE